MALRLANKINRQIVNNVCRSLSAKRDADLEPAVQKVEEASKAADVSVASQTFTGPSIPVQYEVCRPRTTPITPFPHAVQNETDAAKKTVALQHLQPSMLPEYFKPPVEINAACMYFDPITETEKQATAKYRQFEQSKTCKNVTLPLRAPKLASPFPDPVKVMQSHTVSDQEKAEQMLAEAKMVKSNTSNAKQKHPSIRSLPPSRSYSTTQQGGSEKKKCPKLNDATKRCPHIKVPGCRPVKSIKCGKIKKERPICQRKPPPYPSYSETCHEDPHNKPSECKTCPYRPDEHPFFKPPKHDFHTFSARLSKHKGECTKPPDVKKKPCEWAEKKDKKESEQKQNANDSQPKKKAMINLLEKINAPLMQNLSIGMKSKTDPFLSRKRQGPAQDQEKAEKIETTSKASKAQRRASSLSLGKEMDAWLNRLQPADLSPPLGKLQTATADHAGGGGKCKKFPFKECTFTIVKKREVRKQYQKCPEKPKRKIVKDCPAEEANDNAKKGSSTVRDVLAYIMSGDKEYPEEEKRRCPRVNLDVCKDRNEYVDDPCKRKRKGKTLICPDDLLGKKHKPKKKKTSPMIPLAQITSVSKGNSTVKV